MVMFRALFASITLLLMFSAGFAIFAIHCGDILHAIQGQSSCGISAFSHGIYHINLFTAALGATLLSLVVALVLFAVREKMGAILGGSTYGRYCRRFYERKTIPRFSLQHAFSRGIIERKEDPTGLYCSQ